MISYTMEPTGLHGIPSATEDLGEVDRPTQGEREKTDDHEPHRFHEPFHSALLMISYTTVPRRLHESPGAKGAPGFRAILTQEW